MFLRDFSAVGWRSVSWSTLGWGSLPAEITFVVVVKFVLGVF